MLRMRTVIRHGAGSAVLLISLLLAACDAAPPTATPIPPPATAPPTAPPTALPLAIQVPGAHPKTVPPPAKLVQVGTLTVGTDASYPPMEYFTPDGKLTGFDLDMAGELANRLGLTLDVENVKFDDLIYDVNTHKFDVGISSISMTDERRRVLTFVPYFATGRAILVRKGNPAGIKTLADLADKPVAVQDGTAEQTIVKKFNDQQALDKKPLIKAQSYPTDTESVQHLRAGDVVAALHQFVVAAYYVKQSPGDFEIANPQFEAVTLGIATSPSSPEMEAPIKAAVEAIQADGTLDDMLRRWGLK